MEYLHYRLFDVSSMKEMVRRFCAPEVLACVPVKRNCHTAREDVLESLEEARFYRELLMSVVVPRVDGVMPVSVPAPMMGKVGLMAQGQGMGKQRPLQRFGMDGTPLMAADGVDGVQTVLGRQDELGGRNGRKGDGNEDMVVDGEGGAGYRTDVP